MTMRRKWLGLAAWALTAVPAVAQDPLPMLPTTQLAPTPVAPRQVAPEDAAARQGMHEDVEIMRRILAREIHAHEQAMCTSCHADPFGAAHNQSRLSDVNNQARELSFWLAPSDSSMPILKGTGYQTLGDTASFLGSVANAAPAASLAPPPVVGTYLKGYGVVFQATLPWLVHGVTRVQAKSVQRASEWERTRKEVRGEKQGQAGPAANAAAKKQEETSYDTVVTDLLVKALADNGRNFSGLAAAEKLTIVVTFRPVTDPHMRGGVNTNLGPNQSKVAGPPRQALFAPAQPLDRTAGGGDLELLGDLQAKQGRVHEAIGVYQKAVAGQTDRRRKAVLYQKIAQAYLKVEDKLSTEAAIAKAIDYLKLAQKSVESGSAGSAAPPPPGPPAPAVSQLIVTVPKGMVDAAAKLTPEEFRRGAYIERVIVSGSSGH